MNEELVKTLRNCGYPNSYRYCPNCVFVGKYGGSCDLKKLLSEAADAIERWQYYNAFWQEAAKMAHENEPKWIPITERLPELGVSVLTYCPAILYIEIQSLEKHVGNLHWENQHGDWQDLEAVDLWMPLPQPPKEET